MFCFYENNKIRLEVTAKIYYDITHNNKIKHICKVFIKQHFDEVNKNKFIV